MAKINLWRNKFKTELRDHYRSLFRDNDALTIIARLTEKFATKIIEIKLDNLVFNYSEVFGKIAWICGK